MDLLGSYHTRIMSEQVQDWLERFSPQNVQIWCEDPETTSSGGLMAKSYLTYRILMKQIGRDIVGTRHRYSDFETLRDGLRDKFAPLGILIPSLPPKTSITAMIGVKPGDKNIFIKERTLGLTMFCEVFCLVYCDVHSYLFPANCCISLAEKRSLVEEFHDQWWYRH